MEEVSVKTAPEESKEKATEAPVQESAEKPAEKGLRCKNMMYVQQLAKLPGPDKTIEAVKKRIETIVKPDKYAIILHDQDLANDGDCSEPHIHAMLSFENARFLSAVAKALGEENAQQIEWWKGNANNGYAYLIHATKNAMDKYQYSPDAVSASFDYAGEMAKISRDVAKAKARGKKRDEVTLLLDAMYDGTISKDDVEKRLTGSQYARYHSQIEAVWAKRLKTLAIEFRKKMQEQGCTLVSIWIYGASETGKSSLAKDILKKRGQTYFVSGSNRDRFQDYESQPSIWLDELRPTDFEFSQLLRLLDPFGEAVVAPSRYHDKALACDFVVISTIYNPFEFHRELFRLEKRNDLESVWQLIRRLSVIIEMDAYTIKAVQYLPKAEKFVPIEGTIRPNPYSGFSRPTPESKAIHLYSEIFKEKDTDAPQSAQNDGSQCSDTVSEERRTENEST